MNNKTSSQMAELYGLPSSTAFNKLLARCGILIHNEKGYVIAETLSGQGYATTVTCWFFLPSGQKASKKRAAWTEKGQALIHQRLGRLGIVPKDQQRKLFTN